MHCLLLASFGKMNTLALPIYLIVVSQPTLYLLGIGKGLPTCQHTTLQSTLSLRAIEGAHLEVRIPIIGDAVMHPG